MREKSKVLVVDRESDAARTLMAFLRAQDVDVVWVRDAESAYRVLDEVPVEAVCSVLNGPRIDGQGILRRALERNPRAGVVLMAEPGEGDAAHLLRSGAADLQVGPLDLERLGVVLRRGLEHQRLARQLGELGQMLDERFGVEHMIGRSPAMARVVESIQHVASTRATVLIHGETGTGKSLVARAIHRLSARRDERFVWVSLGAAAGGVLESELFGAENGDAPGSSGPRRGRLELADGGTLFLDRVDEAPASVQVRLLRALRDHEFERVGGENALKVDVRIVAATPRDLEAEVGAGRFRQDLFERLGAVVIRTPPLRERPEDIPLLVEQFLRDLNREHNRRITGLSRGVVEGLMRHDWPGNLRGLRQTVAGMAGFRQRRRPADPS